MNKLICSAFAAVLLAGSAQAADLYTPEVVQAPAEVQVASVSGWYLRGDVSYDIMRMRGGNYDITNSSTGYVGGNSFDKTTLKDTANIGIGAGYQFNNYLRSDVTLDYNFRTTFNGSTAGFCGSGDPCNSDDISHMTLFSLLANAYVDLGTYGSVTPYVGGGLGVSHVDWDVLSNSDPDGTFIHGGTSSWRFTWALMAGASVDLTCNLKADVGYRYRHVNGGPMFNSISFNSGVKVGPGRDNGFDIHEVRAGLRYQFGNGGCGQVAYVPPAPMPVYK